jgi:plastocyanin
MLTRPLLPACATALLALAATAQITWTVTLNSTSFSPKNLVVSLGDTVQWTIPGTQFHDVTSGAGGVPDGNFGSGSAV